MEKNGWQERVFRAKTLAHDYPFAAEILNFYCTLAEFQEGLFQRIEAASGGDNTGHSTIDSSRAATAATSPGPKSGGIAHNGTESLQGRHPAHEPGPRQQSSGSNPSPLVAGPPELSTLLASFPEFLALVDKHGPQNLANAARELHSAPLEIQTGLLNDFWDAPRIPSEDSHVNDSAANDSATNEFFARAFLQPYAEFTRLRAETSSNGYTGSLCPFCGRKPGVAVLRPLGDGGQRRLVCSFCLAEWEFRRIVCANCGEQDHKKLPVYTADQFPHVRVDCCDRCRRYLKTIDLTKTGLADPIVDELATIPLDLWAREHGYEKLERNLLQL